MNIIPFVFTILILLITITYNKLSSFLVHTTSAKIAVRHIKEKEIAEINLAQNEMYQKKSCPGTSHEQGTKIAASRTICFNYLINKETKAEKPETFNTAYTLLKRLILNLYKDQPFMQKLLKDRPDAVDTLLQKVIEKAESEEYSKKMKKKEDLANLSLDDEDLQLAWATMLNGREQKETSVDNAKSNHGFPSLWKFLNASMSKKQPIRLYLASKELLLAIFEDEEEFVEMILKERDELSKSLRRKGEKKISNEDATMTFKNLVEGKIPSGLDRSFFNLEVSSTKP